MSMQQELISKIQTVLRARYGGVDESARAALFNDYDADHNGVIDGSELGQILADAGVGNALTRQFWVKGVMVKLDRDENGTIDLEEFEAAIGGPKPTAGADADAT